MSYTIQDWTVTINNSDLPTKVKAERILYAQKAFKNNVPVIIDLKHLSLLLGLKTGVLSGMIKKPSRFYRKFKIPKKRGGFRDIVTPYKSLLEAQQWIVENILSKYHIHDAAYAYVKKRNIAQNATLHIGNKEMLKLDLENFFPSIKIPRVRELFSRLGYSKDVAYYLCNLCCLNDNLPQGAASSPILSNIILRTLDTKLKKLSKYDKLVYSRYADDLVFSGDYISDSFKKRAIINIEGAGFKVNPKKTISYTGFQRKLLTGLVVNDTSIRLPKSTRREIKQQVHYIIKYGIMDQIKKYNDIYYLDRVLGRLCYWKQIEPNNEYVLNSLRQIKLLYTEALKGEEL